MSSLTAVDKQYLETIFGMSGGYVLSFTDTRFADFFRPHKVEIHSNKYQIYGSSKAKKMRAFWERESDLVVGPVLSELLDNYEATCEISGNAKNTSLLTKCRDIEARLFGKKSPTESMTPESFLNEEFKIPNIQSLPVEYAVSEVIKSRLEEARLCLGAGAYLSVIFQCGSILEAVLLGAAQKEPEKFNRSRSSPKRHDKTKPLHEWTLSEYIDVAHDVGILKPDVHKFSHGLRDFRNYIHPYEQMQSGFVPDEYTAKVCFQVLKAALASVSGAR